jgi:putative transposase
VAQPKQHNSIDEVLELLNQPGSESLRDALGILFNAAMLLERQHFLNAEPYERTPERRDYANGFKAKRWRTRLGALDLQVPQVRKGDFYPSVLERGTRSERALKLALAEMYVQGVSTRKVAAITEQLCGFEVSSSQVSRATAELDRVFQQ